MRQLLKRLLARPEVRATIVHPALGAALVAQASWPEGVAAESALAAPLQIDGDPAHGRLVVSAPRDVFIVPGGPGLPSLALVNVRDLEARVELWALASPTAAGVPAFTDRRELRFPPGHAATGGQASRVAVLPRLQCLLVLRHDAEPRTALVAVLDIASGALRALGVAEPDPFANGLCHVAALRAGPDAVLVRWHSGRVKLGRWGDVAREDHVVLFTPRERDGLPVLGLALADGNLHAWAMHGATLWMQAIDGWLRPAPRIFTGSLDLARVLWPARQRRPPDDPVRAGCASRPFGHNGPRTPTATRSGSSARMPFVRGTWPRTESAIASAGAPSSAP